MLKSLLGTLIAMGTLALVFSLLQRFWPQIRGQRLYRPGFWTDVFYWLASPILNRGFGKAVLVAAFLPLAWVLGVPLEVLRQGYGPIADLPLWLQAMAIIVFGDFLGYWAHRFMHQGWWWGVHSVHHSSRQVDWLAAARVHPFNEALGLLARVGPLVALGFAPVAVAGLQPIFTLYAITLHANLDWDYGLLRYVIASPRFHRWHHSDRASAQGQNFAGLLPLWDLLFGTFYMPRMARPNQFGIAEPIPETILGQLLWPFRVRPTALN